MGEELTQKRIFADGVLKVNSVDDEKNYRASLMLLNGKKNRNGWVYENIEKNLNQFVSIPLMCAFFDGEAHGHDFEMKIDKATGVEYASFIGAKSEQPVGWIEKFAPNGESNAYIETIDGVDWVCIHEGLLPLFYNYELVNALEKNGGKMRVSIETLVTKNRIENDVEYEEEWKVVGVTIIGVAEAVVGANIKKKMNSFSEELKELKLRVASMNEKHIEPQTQKQENLKGEKKTMKVLRKEDLKDKFNGYSIVGIDGLNVALLSNEGRTCTYSFAENEETVAPEKISEVVVNAVFGEGENAVNVPIENLINEANAKANAAQSALEKQVADNAALKKELDDMKKAETERRKKLVIDAIKDELALNEKSFNVKFDETICADMLTDEQVCEFAKKENEKGFCGDEEARREVNSRCVREMRKRADNKAKLNAYTWQDGTSRLLAEADETDDLEKSLHKIFD